MLGEWIKRHPAFVVRPARLNDAVAVTELCNAWSMRMEGSATHDANEQRLDWQTPGFDLDSDTLVVENERSLIAYAFVWDTSEPHVRVGSFLRMHPDVDDSSLAEALLDWLESRARCAIPRAPADARVIVTHGAFSKDARRRELLVRHGYTLVRHFVRLRMELDGSPVEPEVPEGITLRLFDPETDLHAVVLTVRDAFRDHWGYVEEDLDGELAQWTHWIEEDTELDPSVWHLACAGDEVVGVSLGLPHRPESEDLAYIFTLGVRRAWRKRGIARALLQHSFVTFQRMGKALVDLDADAASLTGAMRLYEGVGMRPVWRNDAYEKELRPGIDLHTRG